jgi:hypothetical protein
VAKQADTLFGPALLTKPHVPFEAAISLASGIRSIIIDVVKHENNWIIFTTLITLSTISANHFKANAMRVVDGVVVEMSAIVLEPLSLI